jgi:hypothetical protein
MPEGFTNKPRILRGAFVEYGLSVPPLVVPFQFNPVELSRNRRLTFSAAGKKPATRLMPGYWGFMPEQEGGRSLRELHQEEDDLLAIREQQTVTVQEESISFEIRLDATDKLNEGDPIAEQFGIAPQLAALELLLLPKDESLMGKAVPRLLGQALPGLPKQGGLLKQILSDLSSGFSFTKSRNPPMVLFIWGRSRVLPVNIDSMNVTETEFSTALNPIRATVSVSLTVIEGPNPVYMYSRIAKEAAAGLNLANAAHITEIVIPG